MTTLLVGRGRISPLVSCNWRRHVPFGAHPEHLILDTSLLGVTTLTFHIWDILWTSSHIFICKNPSAIFEKKVHRNGITVLLCLWISIVEYYIQQKFIYLFFFLHKWFSSAVHILIPLPTHLNTIWRIYSTFRLSYFKIVIQVSYSVGNPAYIHYKSFCH